MSYPDSGKKEVSRILIDDPFKLKPVVPIVYQPTVIYLGKKDADSGMGTECHETSASVKEPIKCPFCGYYAKNGNLKPHLSVMHKGNKLYMCTTCSNIYSDRNVLRQHILTHNTNAKLDPRHDKKTFSSVNCKKNEKITVGGYYRCQYCYYKTKKKSEFLNHRLRHKKVRPYMCKMCVLSFTNRNDFGEHFLTHFTKKKFSCKLCEFAHSHKLSLDEHMINQHGMHPSESYRNRNHIKGPGVKKSVKQIPELRMDVFTEVFPCTICDVSYTRETSLNEHMQKCHKEVTGSKTKVYRPRNYYRKEYRPFLKPKKATRTELDTSTRKSKRLFEKSIPETIELSD